jgi:hypothetical protein
MAAKLTRLTHKLAIRQLVAESCTICSSRSRRPVRKLLDTSSHLLQEMHFLSLKLMLAVLCRKYSSKSWICCNQTSDDTALAVAISLTNELRINSVLLGGCAVKCGGWIPSVQKTVLHPYYTTHQPRKPQTLSSPP